MVLLFFVNLAYDYIRKSQLFYANWNNIYCKLITSGPQLLISAIYLNL